MHRKRKRTVSDEPFERNVYEDAGKEEETFLILEFKEGSNGELSTTFDITLTPLG